MAPRLETERLILRGLTAEDLEPQASMLRDPEVVRFLSGQPMAREDVWRRLLAGHGLWSLLGYGYWIVERKEDGACIGQVGFADFKRDIDPSIEGVPEMGWLFVSSVHGRGYASEAVAAGLEWADRNFRGCRFVALIDPDNAPSLRLAERAGFSEVIETRYQDRPVLLLRRPPADR